ICRNHEGRFARELGVAAVFAEAYAHAGHVFFRYPRRAVTETLRPEIPRLLAAARDGPVLHHRLPRLSALRGVVDGIAYLRVGRIAGGDVSRGIDRHGRLLPWR